MDHRSRAKLIDVPERRAVSHAQEFEFRMDKASGMYVLEGYASTWDEYDCYGGVEAGGWVEQIDRAAMKRTLGTSPDLMFLVNHEGLPLARTTTDTLKLETDTHGLLMRAFMDPEDPDVQRIAPKLKPQANGRSNMDEMSFAFRVKDQQWDNNYSHRLITELSLQKGDVSLVNYGMNPNTHIHVMDAVGQLSRMSEKDLVEVRGLGQDVLVNAARKLELAMGIPEGRSAFGGGGAFVDFDGGHLLYEGNCVTCQGARNRGSLGNVPYADPGFIDGVTRLPVDDIHVKASWQWFNQSKNQTGYTSDQVSQIRGSIQTAMALHGHELGEENGMADSEISHIESVRKFGGGVTLVAVHADGTRTPLPSFRQSGELVGAGAGGGGNPFGARGAGDNQDDQPDGGPEDDVDSRKGKVPPQFQGKGDAEDDPAKGGDSGKDEEAEGPDGKKKPEKKSDDGMEEDELPDMETYGLVGANGHPIGCDCADCMSERADPEPDEPQDERSVSERLSELRRDGELPDRPTLTEAMGYLQQLK